MRWRLKNNMSQWNKELILWRDKHDWQILSQINQKTEEKAQINKERRDINNRYHWNPKDH
jgi:hypothetical protein